MEAAAARVGRRAARGGAALYFATKRMDSIGVGDVARHYVIRGRLEAQLLGGQNVDAKMGTKAHFIVNIPSYSRKSCNTGEPFDHGESCLK